MQKKRDKDKYCLLPIKLFKYKQELMHLICVQTDDDQNYNKNHLNETKT